MSEEVVEHNGEFIALSNLTLKPLVLDESGGHCLISTISLSSGEQVSIRVFPDYELFREQSRKAVGTFREARSSMGRPCLIYSLRMPSGQSSVGPGFGEPLDPYYDRMDPSYRQSMYDGMPHLPPMYERRHMGGGLKMGGYHSSAGYMSSRGRMPPSEHGVGYSGVADGPLGGSSSLGAIKPRALGSGHRGFVGLGGGSSSHHSGHHSGHQSHSGSSFYKRPSPSGFEPTHAGMKGATRIAAAPPSFPPHPRQLGSPYMTMDRSALNQTAVEQDSCIFRFSLNKGQTKTHREQEKRRRVEINDYIEALRAMVTVNSHSLSKREVLERSVQEIHKLNSLKAQLLSEKAFLEQERANLAKGDLDTVKQEVDDAPVVSPMPSPKSTRKRTGPRSHLEFVPTGDNAKEGQAGVAGATGLERVRDADGVDGRESDDDEDVSVVDSSRRAERKRKRMDQDGDDDQVVSDCDDDDNTDTLSRSERGEPAAIGLGSTTASTKVASHPTSGGRASESESGQSNSSLKSSSHDRSKSDGSPRPNTAASWDATKDADRAKADVQVKKEQGERKDVVEAGDSDNTRLTQREETSGQ
eukprot:GFYU01001110.1.p1 GENE.GFYU01001110.1~~GFYU01001110.1.p1  ORF type:complete len:584 (+),score=47.73 GFYU01001110.1:134-1885(+)